MIRLLSTAPTFPVADVKSTAHWYEQNLGFSSDFFPGKEPYVFASMWRGGVEIMLMRIENYQKPDISHLRPAGLWDVYIRIEGVKEFYEIGRASCRERV